MDNGIIFSNKEADRYQGQINKAKITDRSDLFNRKCTEPSEGGASK
jgi:hypothetical protein